MKPSTAFAAHIAQTVATARWTQTAVRDAIQRDVPDGLPSDHLDNLAAEILSASGVPYAPSPQRLLRIVRECPTFWKIWEKCKDRISSEPQLMRPPVFNPVPAFASLDIPQLVTLHDLSDWLGLSPGELDWLAARNSHTRPSNKTALQHYHCSVRHKPSGRFRLIEAPKTRLKTIQRQILRDILNHVPTHENAHGFIRGRSAVSAASLHAGEAMVINCDLADFFPSIPRRRVHGIYRCLGYPWQVSSYLTGLTTTRTPLQFLQNIRFEEPAARTARSASPFFMRAGALIQRIFAPPAKLSNNQINLYYHPHLPQGAPTSPMLANLTAYRLDCRLAGLARRFEARYTRYADDLTFSGDTDFAHSTRNFLHHAGAIVRDEGFHLFNPKTKVMGAGGHQTVTGITVNQHVNLSRKDYDRLKALLHNCVTQGPASQNHKNHPYFRAYLEGRVNWVEHLNLNRGRKLRALFERIEWEE